MTKEETRAVGFVGVLLLLAIVARFVTRPKPIMITAGPVDVAALRAAGEAMAEKPPPKKRGRKTPAVTRARPADPIPPARWTEPAWRRSRSAPVYIWDDPASAKATGPLNLNRASLAEIDGLPGVSPTIAKRIVARRDSVGRFEKLEDLDPVKGIGPALIEKLRGKVVFR